MKIFLIVLIITFSYSAHAQEKDSSLCHYGFVMDYQDGMINQIGIKYRQTESIAYFFKGNLFTRKPFPINPSEGFGSNDIRTYGGVLGIEYTIHSVDNILLSVLVSGGITIDDYNTPYFTTAKFDDYLGNFDEQQITYSLTTGLGVEYFFSKHISIGCSQLISFNHSKGKYYILINPDPGTYTEIQFGKTIFALSFYF